MLCLFAESVRHVAHIFSDLPECAPATRSLHPANKSHASPAMQRRRRRRRRRRCVVRCASDDVSASVWVCYVRQYGRNDTRSSLAILYNSLMRQRAPTTHAHLSLIVPRGIDRYLIITYAVRGVITMVLRCAHCTRILPVRLDWDDANATGRACICD